MRVLIYEPQYVGHNLAYVNYLATRLIEMGCEAHLVTSQQAMQTEEFSNHLGHLCPKLICTGIDGFVRRSTGRGISVNAIQGTRSLVRGLRCGLEQVEPNHVFIPCGNPLAHWMGFPISVSRLLKRKGIEAEIVLLFGKYAYAHRGLKSFLKEKLALAALANGPWTRVHHILPRAVRTISSFSRGLALRTRWLPDPIDPPLVMTRSEARKLLGIPQEGRIVALVGLIERRKGVVELLDAFQRSLGKLDNNDRVLLAGKSTDEVRDMLGNRFRSLVLSGRLISLDRHLTRHELWGACYASDVVTTPYPNHVYSASIVIRAAAANRPVLANAVGWMGDTIQKYSLGTICNTNDIQQFAVKLVNCLAAAQAYTLNEQAEQFVAMHSEVHFANRLTQRLCERMNLCPTATEDPLGLESAA